jgi:arylsulfatase A-like enzyme
VLLLAIFILFSSTENHSGNSLYLESPNFLFITIDTLRRSELGFYGSPTSATPVLDALAEKSVVFERYYAAANCTIPSHLSIFSGKKVSTIGIYDHEKSDISKSLTIFPTLLKREGYKTFGVSSVFFMGTQWIKGFGDQFDQYVTPDGEFKAREVVSQFRELLPKIKKDKFFVWLHFYDPHAPYDPPPQFKKSFSANESGLSGKIPEFDESSHAFWIHQYGLKYKAQVRDLYKGEVAYTDREIGKVLALMEENLLDRNAVTVIMADHGEFLGEHQRLYTHGDLYEDVLHVPLLFYSPRIPPGRVAEFVSSVDISATILNLAASQNEFRSEGISLVPYLKGKTPFHKRILYSHAAHNAAVSMIQPPFKLIYNAPAISKDLDYELYDVIQDPMEKQNRFQEDRVTVLSILSDSVHPASEIKVMRESLLTPEDKEKLFSIGYVQ